MCTDVCLLTCLQAARSRFLGSAYVASSGCSSAEGGSVPLVKSRGIVGRRRPRNSASAACEDKTPNTLKLGCVEPERPLNAEPHEYGAGRPDEQGRRRGRPGKFDFHLLALAAVSMLAAN